METEGIIDNQNCFHGVGLATLAHSLVWLRIIHLCIYTMHCTMIYTQRHHQGQTRSHPYNTCVR